jgi:heptosyltransferase-2
VVAAATQLPCRPCHKPTCRLGHHRCMHDIDAATVTEAVQAAFGSAAQPSPS